MRQRAIVLSFTLAVMVGVGVRAFYSFSKGVLRRSPDASQVTPPQGAVLQAPPTTRQGDLPAPPPPTGNGTAAPPMLEPSRTLVGVTQERLRHIEQSLPAGSQAYINPIGSDKSVAALTEADLDSDGTVDTVVVYKKPLPTPQGVTQSLVLCILTPEGEGFSARASVALEGGVLFNIRTDESESPLVVRDVTGDGRPEIIVASGVGASLGGELQVFKVTSTSLERALNVEGNIFQVHKQAGQLSVIKAQSRYRAEAISYRWNGQQFVQVTGE
jgi:hypothetical protein